MRICYVIRSETLRNHVFWTSYFPEEKSNMFTVIYERIRSQIRKIMKSLDELKRIVSEDPFKGLHQASPNKARVNFQNGIPNPSSASNWFEMQLYLCE